MLGCWGLSEPGFHCKLMLSDVKPAEQVSHLKPLQTSRQNQSFPPSPAGFIYNTVNNKNVRALIPKPNSCMSGMNVCMNNVLLA